MFMAIKYQTYRVFLLNKFVSKMIFFKPFHQPLIEIEVIQNYTHIVILNVECYIDFSTYANIFFIWLKNAKKNCGI